MDEDEEDSDASVEEEEDDGDEEEEEEDVSLQSFIEFLMNSSKSFLLGRRFGRGRGGIFFK